MRIKGLQFFNSSLFNDIKSHCRNHRGILNLLKINLKKSSNFYKGCIFLKIRFSSSSRSLLKRLKKKYVKITMKMALKNSFGVSVCLLVFKLCQRTDRASQMLGF